MANTLTILQQAAAIPVRSGAICLVTNRSGKRWVVPKGCLEPGKTPSEIALQEAWEEAGLVGILQPDPVGSFLYDKGGITCYVVVFLLRVTQVVEHWPEEGLRERVWVSPHEAVARIEDRGLRDLLRASIGQLIE